jgi:hypothetical protein
MPAAEPAPEAEISPAVTPQWPSSPAAPGGQVPPPPPPPAYGPTPQTSNNAVAALVLSITSWVFCPVIPAIIALVFASKADKEIAASNGWVTGGGMVTASKIVSWINIGLYAALIAIGLIIFVIAVVGGALSSM